MKLPIVVPAIKKLIRPVLAHPKVAAVFCRLALHVDSVCYRALNELLMHANGGVHPKHRLMNYAQYFVDHIKETDRVLDVGCGRGTVAARLAEKAQQVLGVDLEAKNISMARRLYARANLRFEIQDATAASFQERFDVAVLSNVLEHIEHRERFLRSMACLAPILLVRVPMIDRDWVVLLKKEWGVPYLSDKTHFIEYTEETFRSEVRKAGLEAPEVTIRFGEIWAVVRP